MPKSQLEKPANLDQPVQCPLCGAAGLSEFLRAPDRFHGRKELYDLKKCNSCACVWLEKPPRPEQMGIHYDEAYHRAIARAGETSPERRWRRHKDLIHRHKKSGALLDIGCSSGGFLGTMKGADWKLYGIEIEAEMAEKARSKTGATVFTGDVADAPFAAESFDVVTCFDVLEHVYDPREFLLQIRRWLKPEGILCVFLPNIDAWESRFFGTYWFGLELPRHLFHFSPVSLRRLLQSLGFAELVLAARNSYLEHSMQYVYTASLERLGYSPMPPSAPRHQSFVWRAIRKVLRICFVRPFAAVASRAGTGAGMEAVFEKAPYVDQ